MAQQPPLRPDETQRVLAVLAPLLKERNVVLVGGQAVAFWAVYLSRPKLKLPVVATRDIDFEGAKTAAQRAAKLLEAEVKIPKRSDRTPITGSVVFLDSDGHRRELDFIESPRGLNARDVRDTAVRVTTADPAGGQEIPFWVMHPERSMESRVYNVAELRRTGAISMDQLKVSIDCAREWSRALLGDESFSARKRQRAVLRLNERIFRKCRSDRSFRAMHRRHQVDPFEAVLVDERLPDEFHERRYPQMLAALDEVRGS
ncbi:hypothetical protein BH20ACT15_BH20ACT15_04490 [soil metagenome]